MKIKKLELKPEVKAEHDRRKYLKDQQEVFCDGVMLHYNKKKKHFELNKIVYDGNTYIDGLDVDIKWDKYGVPYILQDVCGRCNGEMRIKDHENGTTYSEDGMMPCPQCEGDGWDSDIEDDGEKEKKDIKVTSHPDRWFINYYHCKSCDEKWEMEWDADCNDKCPMCHSEYTPYKTEEFDDE